MSKSKAQRFAQKRNTAGGTLKGIVINLEKNIIPVATDMEVDELKIALSHLEGVLAHWNNNYKESKSEHV